MICSPQLYKKSRVRPIFLEKANLTMKFQEYFWWSTDFHCNICCDICATKSDVNSVIQDNQIASVSKRTSNLPNLYLRFELKFHPVLNDILEKMWSLTSDVTEEILVGNMTSQKLRGRDFEVGFYLICFRKFLDSCVIHLTNWNRGRLW